MTQINVNIDNNAIPKTISGITIGIYNISFIIFLPLKSNFLRPIADIVPITVEIIVLVTDTIKVFLNASKRSIFINNSLYHLKVNPLNIIFNLEVLNEKKTKTNIGKYKNNKTKKIYIFLIFFILHTS